MKKFSDLNLVEPLLRAVKAEGYDTPTPIQAQAIPPALTGKDVLGVAQTGTGKTAAFTLPILQRLEELDIQPRQNTPLALILTPTRELAIQISESLKTYGKYLRQHHTVIFGGVGQNPQVAALRRGVDTLVATPGRLLDLMEQGHVYLDEVETFVLDEADRMLDMGFIHDVRKVVKELPKQRQTLLFSATMPSAITSLAEQVLLDYVRIEVKPAATTADRVDQRVMFVEKSNKRKLLEDLFSDPDIDRAIVFTRTKHGANRVAKFLNQRGIESDAIHGNKSQGARQRALKNFKDGGVRALIATDIASRGIDVEDVSHVINFDLPNEPESYVHRIGRTARAGADGMAVSFCDEGEVDYLRDIEKIIRQKVEVDGEHAFHEDRIARMHADHTRPRAKAPSNSRGGGQRGRSSRNGGGRSGGRGRRR
ncbi:MAG: DEAD/DEAH box helicase [Rhodothermales bacterium]|nr:DEAD/DEAH box helicase [Rhodothermales bacterium]